MLIFTTPRRYRGGWTVLALGMAMLLIIAGSVTPASAQGTRTDRDGDGIPNDSDLCPDRPGPLENRGCPLDDNDDSGGGAPPSTPGDRDGDGVTDDVDFCIDQPGPLENGGCPLPEATPLPSEPRPILPPLGAEDARCVAATDGFAPVNLRAWPTVLAPVVSQIDPFSTVPVLMRFSTPEGDWLRTYDGWFAGLVARLGGACDNLPHLSTEDINPTFLPQTDEIPPYVQVADLKAVMLACDGAVHGVLFAMNTVELMASDAGDCIFPIGPEGYGLRIGSDGGITYGGPDTRAILNWSWGNDINRVAGIQPTPFNTLSPGVLAYFGPPDGEGSASGVVIMSADLSADAWLGAGASLADYVTEPVWDGLFARAMNPTPLDDHLPVEAAEATHNLGISACDDSSCLTAVLTFSEFVSDVMLTKLTDCFTVELGAVEPPREIQFQTPPNCGSGYLKGTSLAFFDTYGALAPHWVLFCGPVMGGELGIWENADVNPFTPTVNWGPIFDDLPIACTLNVLVIPE